VPIDHNYAGERNPKQLGYEAPGLTKSFFGNHRAWPLRIMCIASIPSRVCFATVRLLSAAVWVSTLGEYGRAGLKY
jgi:hypothetical protein